MAQLGLFVALMLVSVALANVVKVGEVSAKKEVMTTVKATVTDIVVDGKTGIMFFNEALPGDEERHTLNIYTPGHEGYIEIKELKGHPQGITINKKTGNVLVGTTKGLFKITTEKMTAELIGEEGKDIINVQYGNEAVYIVTNPGSKPYKSHKVDGEFKLEMLDIEHADRLIVDSKENIFYLDENRHLQKRPYGQTESIPIKGLEGKEITATTVSPDDGIYIAAGKENWILRKGLTEVKTALPLGKEVITAAFVDINKVSYVAEGHTIYKFTRL